MAMIFVTLTIFLSMTSAPNCAPLLVITLTGLFAKEKIKKIIAIGNSSYAVDTSGQLWAWGDNTFGQLGVGNVVNQNIATALSTMPSHTDLYHP